MIKVTETSGGGDKLEPLTPDLWIWLVKSPYTLVIFHPGVTLSIWKMKNLSSVSTN